MSGNFSKISTKLPVSMGMERNMGEKFRAYEISINFCSFPRNFGKISSTHAEFLVNFLRYLEKFQ